MRLIMLLQVLGNDKTISRYVRLFHLSSSMLLAVFGCIKLIAWSAGASILSQPDDIFGVSRKTVYLVVGSFEMLAAFYLLLGRNSFVKTAGLFWLSLHFLFYRIAQGQIGSLLPCPCLGVAADWFPGPPVVLDSVAHGAALFLLLGGGFFLAVGIWNNHFKIGRQS